MHTQRANSSVTRCPMVLQSPPGVGNRGPCRHPLLKWGMGDLADIPFLEWGTGDPEDIPLLEWGMEDPADIPLLEWGTGHT